MFRATNGWFRDFACFAAFLVLFASLVESGYGQQAASLHHAAFNAVPPQPPAPSYSSPALTSTRPATVDPTTLAAARTAAVAGPRPSAPPHVPAKPTELSAASVRPHFAGNPKIVADPTDPYIVAQAQALNNNPNQIFAFVRDQIGFEVYAGSLRGSRGTLWSKAGNSLDKASLLIALLGAAGVGARYVQGTPTLAQQQQLIASMFTSPSRVSGCVPLNVTRANPTADPTLLANTAAHFWVEFGSGFTPADPNFPTAQIGQVFGTPTQRFTTIPASLETMVTFRLDVEEYSQASALFGGDGISTTEVLNETLNAAELAGSPVTVGNLVTSNQAGIIISATTHTYSPYLRYAVNPADAHDVVLTGQQYQEDYTNFPLGTQVLTGVFLNIDVTGPGGQMQTFQHTMLDRLGYAARAGLATVNVSTPANLAPALTQLDLVTVNAISGLQDTSILNVYQAAGAAMDPGNATLHAQVANVSFSNPSDADQVTMQNALVAERENLVLMARAGVSAFAATSDAKNAQLSPQYFVKPYYNSPRLILYTSSLLTATGGAQSLALGFDLLKNDMLVLSPPGQAANAPFDFNIMRGLSDNAVEETVAKQLTQSITGVNTIGIQDILQGAQAQGIPVLAISSANVGTLDPLSISANAKARITTAVEQGHVVMVPSSPVNVNGLAVIGWVDHDPSSGYTTGTMENGTHDLTGYVGLLAAVVRFAVTVVWIAIQASAFILGFALGAVLASVLLLNSNVVAGLASVAAIVAVIVSFVYALVTTFPVPIGLVFLTGLIAGATAAAILISLHSRNPVISTRDLPRLQGSTTNDVFPFASNLGLPSVGTPGSSPAVSLSLGSDSTLVLPFDGVQLPLVFDAQIKNLGPAADQFQLNVTPPSGYSVETSLPSVTIPAGQTGQIGFCLVPTGALPAPGTIGTVNATASSVSNSSVTGNGSTNVTTPTVQAITLSATPSSLSAMPGNGASTSLLVQSVGNASVTTGLTATAQAGVTVSGLSSPITLGAGQSTTQTLTLTAASSAPLGSQLPVLISATGGDPNNPPSTAIQFTVTSAQAQSAVAGAQSAANLGRSDIATTLSGLSGAINSALGSCSSTTQMLVLDYLNNLIQEMNAPFLQSFSIQLQSAQSAIASSTCANLGAALSSLSTILASLNSALSSSSAFPFNISLQPNTAVAQPNQATQFVVFLQNNSTSTNTYTLSLGALPSGVTGSLSTSSVTLGPGQSVPQNGSLTNPTVTITPSGAQAFSFTVTASVNGVSGSAQTASGVLTARNQFLQVQDVTATPGFTASGGSVDVTAHIANVVNQAQTVKVALAIQNSSNVTVANGPTQSIALSVTSLITAVDFGQISTQGFANGNYTLLVTVTDTNNNPIPGGTGSGVLLVGSPVTATLTLNPTTLAPGNGKVTTTLTVNTNNVNNGGAPFSLLGSLPLASAANTIALNGNTAYSCDANEVSIVDITDPTHLNLLGTALAGSISNANDINCSIQRGDLVILADTGSTLTSGGPAFVAFDLTNPLSPTLIKSTPVSKRFFSAPFYVGNFAFFGTSSVSFIGGGVVVDQFGDFVSLNVADFTNPFVTSTLEQPQRDATFGGAFNTYGAVQGPGNIAYVGSTSSQGANTTQGSGQLWVVDISNPASLSFIEQINIPGTRQTAAPFVQGNLAVTVSNTLGWRSPGFGNGTPAQIGNLVITVFDITNPRSPQILSNTTTTLIPGLGSGGAIIGTNLFLVNGQEDAGGNPILFTIDTTNPASPVIKTYPVPANINSLVPRANILYAATSDHGFQTYSIPGTGAIQYTATIQAAKSGGVAYDATTFSTPPTSITPGATFDLLTWVNPPSNVITFNSNVTGIQAGQVLPVDFGGSVSFTSSQGPGTDTLPPLNVNSGQILGINPATQTVAPGGSASYTLTASNPTSSAVTYNLSIAGVPSRWVTLPATVNVPASGSTNVTLTLQTAFADLASTNGFQVTASAGGVSGSVNGTLVIQGTANIGAVTSPSPVGVVVTLTPGSATAGQGTAATYVVQVTNTGSAADTFTLSGALPAGVTGVFDQTSLQIPPGLSNFRQVNLHLTPARGTAAGAPAFTVTALSSSNSAVTGHATGTLNIANGGVSVALIPSTTAPGSALQMTVTNTGTVADTYSLSLGGAAMLSAQLASNSVTLAPGASQVVGITIGAVSAPPGTISLVAVATSQSNSAISAAAQASVVVPSSSGMTATFSPSTLGIAVPGPATFLLQVQNTGNVQDSYQATITGTTGPITASLVDITGQSVQTTSAFILPGLALGQLALNTTLTGNSTGTVTVKVTSTSNASITSTTTATLQIGVVNGPVANAGKNHNLPTGHYAMLDGSQSFDPAGNRITYAWSLVSAPAGSQTTGPFPATGVRPVFLADVSGAYKFQLIVNNGTQTSAPSTVVFTAFTGNVPPNANTGLPLNGIVGKSVPLDGSASYDPDQGPKALTYLWQVQQAPAGSAVTNNSITNAAAVKASFIPDVTGTYVLGLQVSDGAASNTDTVTVAVASTDAPNAVPGPDRRVMPGAQVTLDGSASFDPAGQALTYQWVFTSSPFPNSALQNPTSAKSGFTPLSTSFSVARLTVDPTVSASANVTVLATTACDANGDGLINQIDFDLMAQISGQAVLAGDPLDVNGDGVIDGKDIAACSAPAPAPPLPSFSVDQTTLVFTYVSGDPKPSAQIVHVTSSGALLPFSVSANAPWVSVSPSSGTTNAAVQISIDPSQLSIGNVSAIVTFAALQPANPGGANVTIVVHYLEPPRLTLTPAVLNFQYQQGSSMPPTPQTVSVVAVTRNLAFTATPSANWIVVSPATTTTPAIETISLANLSSLSPGGHQGSITFTANDGAGPPQTVQVNLTVLPAPPAITAAGVVNAASQITGAVAPGEIVNISGSYFGPLQAAKAAGTGFVANSLADTQALFEGVPAPVLSAVSGQLQIVAPFFLDGRTTASLQVVYQGVVSNVVGLTLAKADPGVYTVNGKGTGQAMALNADGTTNSTTNPAAGGTKLTFYLTGGGILNPPGFDGRIATAPLAALAQPISVQIGGQPAQATAGDALGMVEGFVQVDVTVPQNLPAGNAVLQVTIGGATSQPGVTVAVR